MTAKENKEEIEEKLRKIILNKLSQVVDFELGIDIVNLGLVYGIEFSRDYKKATVSITFTTPSCPYLSSLLDEIKRKLSEIEEIEEIVVNVVWDPPWSVERMSKEAREMLGL